MTSARSKRGSKTHLRGNEDPSLDTETLRCEANGACVLSVEAADDEITKGCVHPHVDPEVALLLLLLSTDVHPERGVAAVHSG